jgi:hypothetical protein
MIKMQLRRNTGQTSISIALIPSIRRPDELTHKPYIYKKLLYSNFRTSFYLLVSDFGYSSNLNIMPILYFWKDSE